MKVVKVEPLASKGNVKATVTIETDSGGTVAGRLIKQVGYRAYLDPPPGLALTHKQKRHLQQDAVKRWASMISGSLEGLLDSETVFTGKRFKRLGVQLKVFCPACDRNTPSEFSQKTENGPYRNACYFCGTFRKGKPFIGRREMEEIQDRLNACEGNGETHADKRVD
ncbi:hypothetical protein PDESU_04271 [Pontiella desulfatans]|uniref:Uncharacterized protein n=1 Tax=Pontiella desulfatans TaxID=2750659 RepID=A0A6C2U8F0_PONDE|nr:hypothetical protein [Pontiella desulfatans]VGO15686.1 hypothetical protein PDESU_04271 [Pontiella desulfatans]